MQNKMKNEKTNGISTIFGQEELRVTCVERKYRVSDSKIGFIITARKELDEDTTQELLHEDMELKTFLSNYQITDIAPVSVCDKPVKIAEKKASTRQTPIENIKTKKEGISTKGDDIIVRNDDVKNSIKHEAMKRMELFDSLDLSETFVIKDYKNALEKKGITTTNTAMPYDDLYRLEKQGKVVRIGKGKRGAISFRLNKDGIEVVT